jgi:hypothetical protein
MPAPRAVLADIHDLNLNPGYAHTITDKGGHLVPPAKIKTGAKHAGVHINQRELPKPAEKPPVQNALKELPKEEEKVVVVKKSKLAAPAPVPVEVAEAVKPVEKPTDEKPAEVKAEDKPAEEKPVS